MERSHPQPLDPAQAHEALRRLDRASDAAGRLIVEAAAKAVADATAGATGAQGMASDTGGSPEPPPAGWQAPEADEPSRHRAAADPELLVALVQSLGGLVPAELQHRLAQALREMLLALRALIDSYLDYLERLERERAEPAEVQDIPIL